MALAAAAVCGCQTSGENRPKKLLSTLRLHLEASRDGTKANEPVPIYREKPVMVNVEKTPFLTEADVAEAKVIDVVGGFALRIQFNHAGHRLLEEYTTANRGRRIAVFSQFGEEIKDSPLAGCPRHRPPHQRRRVHLHPGRNPRRMRRDRARPEQRGQESSNMDRP